jgi:hypothetical protein
MAFTRRYRSGWRLNNRPLCRCESDTQGVVGVGEEDAADGVEGDSVIAGADADGEVGDTSSEVGWGAAASGLKPTPPRVNVATAVVWGKVDVETPHTTTNLSSTHPFSTDTPAAATETVGGGTGDVAAPSTTVAAPVRGGEGAAVSPSNRVEVDRGETGGFETGPLSSGSTC